ncbi:MAG: HigA family addiction module antidote protein [Candidatus Peribacteria bacterium]|nr:HigA family addiction module antidote protein [Candidatus Peribacteria bacterium]
MTKREYGIPLAFHPGEYINREINERGRTQKRFADILGIDKSELNNLIKGRRNVTPRLAMRLSKAFGTGEKVWMNLQNRYDLYLLNMNEEEMEDINEIPSRVIYYTRELVAA